MAADEEDDEAAAVESSAVSEARGGVASAVVAEVAARLSLAESGAVDVSELSINIKKAEKIEQKEIEQR